MTVRMLLRCVLGLAVALFVTVVPVVYYRCHYNHAKRLRVVEPGRLYRCGQMTTDGFAAAIRELGIRTVVNLQDEAEDPDLWDGYFTYRTRKESEVCRELGVRYVYMPPELVKPAEARRRRPETIAEFLKLMDDDAALPVLIHCKAGLHRTGIMVAVYRMEYDGWRPGEAVRELLDNGFGRFPCSTANDYITQYILSYTPRMGTVGAAVAPGPQ